VKKIKLAIGFLAILFGALAIHLALKSEKALVTHPKGIIALSELNLMTTVIFLMLIVVVPTFIFLFIATAKSGNKKYPHTKFSELILWIIPAVVIAVMAVVTWDATHKLDPYRPLVSDVPPLKIQVVALDWKWLFIYPEQGIATVNFLEFPAKVPIEFFLAADGSPMNSFWLPELSGQIYAMTGMTTKLHIMADGPGVYTGRASEINGKGYADMTFVAKSSTQSDFDDWVSLVRLSPLQLTDLVYDEFAKPSLKLPVTLYSSVEKDLFHKIVMKYMHMESCKNCSSEN
jgi:cytochrome o ubiquinol oxidase subunit 2